MKRRLCKAGLDAIEVFLRTKSNAGQGGVGGWLCCASGLENASLGISSHAQIDSHLGNMRVALQPSTMASLSDDTLRKVRVLKTLSRSTSILSVMYYVLDLGTNSANGGPVPAYSRRNSPTSREQGTRASYPSTYNV